MVKDIMMSAFPHAEMESLAGRRLMAQEERVRWAFNFYKCDGWFRRFGQSWRATHMLCLDWLSDVRYALGGPLPSGLFVSQRSNGQLRIEATRGWLVLGTQGPIDLVAESAPKPCELAIHFDGIDITPYSLLPLRFEIEDNGTVWFSAGDDDPVILFRSLSAGIDNTVAN